MFAFKVLHIFLMLRNTPFAIKLTLPWGMKSWPRRTWSFGTSVVCGPSAIQLRYILVKLRNVEQIEFPQALCNLMETAQSTLSRWTAECGLRVNPEKTELVLITRKYKIPSLTLPKLHQTRLTVSNQPKNLGVILDKKLYWTDNIIDRTHKSAIALFACKKAIGRKWGFSPVIVHWL